MKVTSLSLSLLLCVVSYQTCQGVPSKSPNGSITWDPLPSLGSFVVEPDQYKTDGNRPATLANMASGWVDIVQPQGFPIDYAVHLIEMIKGEQEPDVIEEIFLGMESFLGIIICLIIGILFFLLLPWIALIFFCCRCCGNCGGKREQENSNLCCKQICLSVCLASSLAVLCAGAVCIDFSNTFMTRAKDTSFQTSFDVLDDLQMFTTGSSGQLSHILEDEYEYVEDLALDDLQNVGMLIAAPVEDYLLEEVQVQVLFNEFEKLIHDLNDTHVTLLRMNVSRTILTQQEETLRTELEDVSKRLDDINTTCAGCVPPNQGLTINIDFNSLPVLDDQISGSNTSIANISSLYNKGVEALDQIESDINSAAEEPINDIEDVISSTSDSIDEIHTGANDQLVAVSIM
ncbi:prominin-1-A-like [Amphiura filiformis]|uniref:prominin-1-A-like n=1 Tax=Amphiura filiformis TaxID=82378 RepID=UPI003B21AF30